LKSSNIVILNVRDAIISQIISIFQDKAWNQLCKVFGDDIDRKLDRLGVRGISEHPLDTSISCQSLVVVIFYFHMHFFD
jgi:hypothetical protein